MWAPPFLTVHLLVLASSSSLALPPASDPLGVSSLESLGEVCTNGLCVLKTKEEEEEEPKVGSLSTRSTSPCQSDGDCVEEGASRCVDGKCVAHTEEMAEEADVMQQKERVEELVRSLEEDKEMEKEMYKRQTDQVDTALRRGEMTADEAHVMEEQAPVTEEHGKLNIIQSIQKLTPMRITENPEMKEPMKATAKEQKPFTHTPIATTESLKKEESHEETEAAEKNHELQATTRSKHVVQEETTESSKKEEGQASVHSSEKREPTSERPGRAKNSTEKPRVEAVPTTEKTRSEKATNKANENKNEDITTKLLESKTYGSVNESDVADGKATAEDESPQVRESHRKEEVENRHRRRQHHPALERMRQKHLLQRLMQTNHDSRARCVLKSDCPGGDAVHCVDGVCADLVERTTRRNCACTEDCASSSGERCVGGLCIPAAVVRAAQAEDPNCPEDAFEPGCSCVEEGLTLGRRGARIVATVRVANRSECQRSVGG